MAKFSQQDAIDLIRAGADTIEAAEEIAHDGGYVDPAKGAGVKCLRALAEQIAKQSPSCWDTTEKP